MIEFHTHEAMTGKISESENLSRGSEEERPRDISEPPVQNPKSAHSHQVIRSLLHVGPGYSVVSIDHCSFTAIASFCMTEMRLDRYVCRIT